AVQSGVEVRRELPGKSRIEEIEAVDSTGIDVAFGGNTGPGEAHRIGHVLFEEKIERTNADEGRRQSGQVRCAGGREIPDKLFAPVEGASHGAPAEPVCLRSPAKFSGRRVLERRLLGACPVIE